MGKDKITKPPEPVKQPDTVDPKARPPKGHRQRGAGTIITAKPNVVTDDGIVLRPHERLPFQLLQEYCQREKRPTPKYYPCAPSHRFRVVLEDPKNAKNDLTFCPEQSFGSDKVAKDYAALLALWNLQKTIPLERKLPEPYCTTWLQLLASEKAESSKSSSTTKKGGASVTAKTAASAADTIEKTTEATTPQVDNPPPTTTTVSPVVISDESAPPAAAPNISFFAGKNSEPSKASRAALNLTATSTTTANADWLCDSCGTQNFHQLMSGAVRTRCFKCQATKSDSCVHVVSATASGAVDRGVNTFCTGTSTAKAAASAATVSAASLLSSTAKKKPPAPVLDLKADSKFKFSSAVAAASHDQAAQLERRRQRNFLDALKLANKPGAVFLSPRMRALLESALGITSTRQSIRERAGDMAVNALSLQDVLNILKARGLDIQLKSTEYNGNMTKPVQSLPQSRSFKEAMDIIDQYLVVESVKESLILRGFEDRVIAIAFTALLNPPLNLIDDINSLFSADFLYNMCSNAEKEDRRKVLRDVLIDFSLEYICLHMDDDDVPEDLQGRDFEKKVKVLDVYRSKLSIEKTTVVSSSQSNCSSSSKAGDTNIMGISITGSLSSDARAALHDLRQYVAWSDQECLLAIHIVTVYAARFRERGERENDKEERAERNMDTRCLVRCALLILRAATGLGAFGIHDDLQLFDSIVTAELTASSKDAFEAGGNDLSTCWSLIEEERESLEAIYAEDFKECRRNADSGTLFRSFEIALEPSSAMSELAIFNNALDGKMVLEMLFHPLLEYPTRVPISFLRCRVSSSDENMIEADKIRALLLQQALWARAAELADEPAMYSLCLLAQGLENSNGDDFSYPVADALTEALKRLDTLPGGDYNNNILSTLFTSSSPPVVSRPPSEVVASEAVHVPKPLLGHSGASEEAAGEDEDGTTQATEITSRTQRSHHDSTRKGGIGNTSTEPSRMRREIHPFWRRISHSHTTHDVLKEKVSGRMAEARLALPAWKSREEFISLIRANNELGVVVTGETGSGKTTQIPQFIHEEYPNAKIVICQPRRLAAVGVASRVAEERGYDITSSHGNNRGSRGSVGYMVKGDSKADADTRILFCTYGVILRRLQEDPDLEAVDFVVLDEVHERGLESDFALALLLSAVSRRRQQQVGMRGGVAYSSTTPVASSVPSRQDLKIILMSATISTEKFADFLGRSIARDDKSTGQNNRWTPAPVLSIPGYTYPVNEYYKADFEDKVENMLRALKRSMVTGAVDISKVTDAGEDEYNSLDSPVRKGEINYGLICKLVLCLVAGAGRLNPSHFMVEEGDQGNVQHTDDAKMLARAQGCILIFMPGVQEISQLLRVLQTAIDKGILDRKSRGSALGLPRLKLMALHGNLSPAEQKNVFELAKVDELKIVVSTNVAEASVTISDVTVVIDSCRVKESDFDESRQLPILVTKFACQDSLRQRRGRAGRTSEGRCFRCITIGTFNKLPVHAVPEILRTPLDRLVLQVKTTLADMREKVSSHSSPSPSPSLPPSVGDNCMQLLGRCPDPPTLSSVRLAERALTRIQALDPKNAEITPLGRHLAYLPCAPRVGRLLIYGALLGCVFESSYIAACITVRSPFVTSSDATARKQLDESKRALLSSFCASSSNDCSSTTNSNKNSSSGTRRDGERVMMQSDYLAMVRAGQEFHDMRGDKRHFCRAKGLSYERMMEIQRQQHDFVQNLITMGFLTSDATRVSDALKRDADCNRHAHLTRVVVACLVAGLYPQIGKILRPPQKFVETVGGAVERDTKAKEIKFYVVNDNETIAETTDSGASSAMSLSSSPCSGVYDNYNIATNGMHRVFIHPSSVNFSNTLFSHSSYLLFGERQLTAATAAALANDSSKVYLRETSEVSVYALLLLGGQLEASYKDSIISVDGWIRFSAPGRIVAIVQALRRGIDSLLMNKIEDPAVSLDASSSPILAAAIKLLATDGI